MAKKVTVNESTINNLPKADAWLKLKVVDNAGVERQVSKNDLPLYLNRKVDRALINAFQAGHDLNELTFNVTLHIVTDADSEEIEFF